MAVVHACVQQSFDWDTSDEDSAARLRIYRVTSAQEEEQNKVIVFLHGMSHHYDKNKKFIHAIAQRGAICWFIEQRGHGYSDGDIADNEVCHIDSFATYSNDFAYILPKIMSYDPDGDVALMGFSMGGTVILDYLHRYQTMLSARIKQVFLLSPMIKLRTGKWLKVFCAITQGKGRCIFNKKFTNGWMLAAYNAMDQLDRIHLPHSVAYYCFMFAHDPLLSFTKTQKYCERQTITFVPVVPAEGEKVLHGLYTFIRAPDFIRSLLAM